jgi:hypothetical protein
LRLHARRAQDLRAKSSNHPAAQVYDGLFRIATFQEILDLIQLKAKEAGLVVAVSDALPAGSRRRVHRPADTEIYAREKLETDG